MASVKQFPFSRRTEHFVPPKQWASMRKAEALEKETGRRIIHFEKGDFQGADFATPDYIVEACMIATKEGHTRYVPGPGLPELRDAIAEEMTKLGRPTVREEVLVTMGAKHALTQSLLTFVEDGDQVIFPNPGYPPDEFWIKYAGGEVIHTPLNPPDYRYDLDALAELVSPKTKMMIVNTPQRPNGQVVTDLDKLAEIAVENDMMIISDEIFSHMIYDGRRHESISAIPEARDRTIVIDTFSKTWVMTGFRIGWVISDAEVIRKLDIFQQNSVTNVAAIIQLAALAAITGDQTNVHERVALLQKRRDQMVEGLRKLPKITCLVPEGSFYCFPDISGTGMTAQQFTDWLLEDYGVAVVAGTAFGSQGEGHVRMTFACPEDVIEEGLERMGEAFATLD